MGADSITEVTSQSWFSRIGNAFKGIIIGLIFFILAFPLLFWNEGRSVKTYKTLKEGAGAVVSVISESVDSANEGKLVHITGNTVTEDVLADSEFGVEVPAIHLARKVEMYQWEESTSSETKKKVGGGTETTTTYSYSKDWSEEMINSASFKEPTGHQNPGSKPYESEEWDAGNVTVGAFALTPGLIDQIDNYEPLAVPDINALPENVRSQASIAGGAVYIGGNPTSPKVGDVRISFSAANPTDVSVIAVQSGHSFVPYKAKTGKSIQMLSVGTHTAESMFEAAQAQNRMLTWILRLVFTLVMFVGLSLILKPMSVLADVLPILGNIVGAGLGFIALLISLTLSFITIAIAWIVYRPLLGIALLVVAGAILFLVKTKLKKATPVVPQPA